jgi:hypothetical protein
MYVCMYVCHVYQCMWYVRVYVCVIVCVPLYRPDVSAIPVYQVTYMVMHVAFVRVPSAINMRLPGDVYDVCGVCTCAKCD